MTQKLVAARCAKPPFQISTLTHLHLAGLAERALAISDSRSAVPDSILKIARHLVLVRRALPPIIATGNCQVPAGPQLARPENVATELRKFLMLIPSNKVVDI